MINHNLAKYCEITVSFGLSLTAFPWALNFCNISEILNWYHRTHYSENRTWKTSITFELIGELLCVDM